MTTREADKIINKILNKEECTEVGIFLSIFANEYMKRYNITEKEFIRSIKNSLKILNEGVKENV